MSCVVPVRDAERHVAAALDSILAQTHRPLEIVVVDDGSTDSTRAIVEARSPLVRVIEGGRSGPAAARNLGLLHARGELVAFLDADDLWLPGKLARQVERFRARPELDCSVTHVRMFWDPEHTGEAERYRDHPRMGPIPGYATTTLLARRAVFDRVGLLDDDLAFADAADWFVRAREEGAVIELLDDVLTLHRLHGENNTRLHAARSEREFLSLAKRVLDARRARATEP